MSYQELAYTQLLISKSTLFGYTIKYSKGYRLPIPSPSYIIAIIKGQKFSNTRPHFYAPRTQPCRAPELFPLLYPPKISNLRTSSTKLSRNRQRNESLSPYTRTASYTYVAASKSLIAVAHAFRINRLTVYKTVKRFLERKNFELRLKKGRPRALDTREER